MSRLTFMSADNRKAMSDHILLEHLAFATKKILEFQEQHENHSKPTTSKHLENLQGGVQETGKNVSTMETEISASENLTLKQEVERIAQEHAGTMKQLEEMTKNNIAMSEELSSVKRKQTNIKNYAIATCMIIIILLPICLGFAIQKHETVKKQAEELTNKNSNIAKQLAVLQQTVKKQAEGLANMNTNSSKQLAVLQQTVKKQAEELANMNTNSAKQLAELQQTVKKQAEELAKKNSNIAKQLAEQQQTIKKQVEKLTNKDALMKVLGLRDI